MEHLSLLEELKMTNSKSGKMKIKMMKTVSMGKRVMEMIHKR